MGECVCVCVAVSLTGSWGLTATVTVVVAAEEGLLAGCGGQARSLVDARWVVGMHVVLSGQAVAGHTAIPMRHLL